MIEEDRYRRIIALLEARVVAPGRPPSLARMHAALKRLELSVDPNRVVVVAGTNGKGTTSAALEVLLRAAGSSTGLFTSPHLSETTERIRLDGVDISRELFCAAWEHIDKQTRDLDLSHFEALTLMAGELFFGGRLRPCVDWAVFEVGLGGLYDPTNAVPHTNCVISALGLDHQAQLGRDIVSIARNKFGIVGPGARVVHAPLPPETHQLSRKIATATASDWAEAPCLSYIEDRSGPIPFPILKEPTGMVRLPLPGRRCVENASLALKAFEVFHGGPKPTMALANLRWPGRLEKVVLDDKSLWLSGDHNLQGMQSLTSILREANYKELELIVGIANDKDASAMLNELSQLPRARLHLTRTAHKGRSPETYGSWLDKVASWTDDPLSLARTRLGAAGPEDLVVVTGSLYLVGQIRTACT